MPAGSPAPGGPADRRQTPRPGGCDESWSDPRLPAVGPADDATDGFLRWVPPSVPMDEEGSQITVGCVKFSKRGHGYAGPVKPRARSGSRPIRIGSWAVTTGAA